MLKSKRRPLAATLVVIVGAGSLICLLVAGCSKKDEAPAGSGTYYTGPMKAKGAGPGAAKAPGGD